MNIEIHQSEFEALIHQRMASGAFHDVEDALIDALKSAPHPKRKRSATPTEQAQTR